MESRKKIIVPVAAFITLFLIVFLLLGVEKRESRLADNNTVFTDSHQVSFVSSTGEICYQIVVFEGDTISSIPEYDSDSDILINWRRVDTGEILRIDTPIYEDVTYYPETVVIDLLVQNALDNLGTSVDDVVYDNLNQLVKYLQDSED